MFTLHPLYRQHVFLYVKGHSHCHHAPKLKFFWLLLFPFLLCQCCLVDVGEKHIWFIFSFLLASRVFEACWLECVSSSSSSSFASARCCVGIMNWDVERKAWLDQNPEYPNTSESIKNKIDYCRLHGIEIVYTMAHLDKELARYWAKLPMIRRLMLSHPEVEWIWWMDCDAFFLDMVFDLPLSKYDKYNLVLHGSVDGEGILENSYYLHDSWAGLIDRYEEMVEKYHPGLGDERWPFVTHFVGCKPCGSYGDYPVERCLSSMERAFNFADNQVLLSSMVLA
ncbi:hypothetical protein K1719_037430 [Acacia pycnantha]|nr:hypothetical protein K1719_037430 [Acacia pycnantha]